MVIFQIPEGIVGLHILGKWQNPNIGSLTNKLRAIMVRTAKWKPLELFLHLPEYETKSNATFLEGLLRLVLSCRT